jgi:hypothetical protein
MSLMRELGYYATLGTGDIRCRHLYLCDISDIRRNFIRYKCIRHSTTAPLFQRKKGFVALANSSESH